MKRTLINAIFVISTMDALLTERVYTRYRMEFMDRVYIATGHLLVETLLQFPTPCSLFQCHLLNDCGQITWLKAHLMQLTWIGCVSEKKLRI